MHQAKHGDRVKVHYSVSREGGVLFETSRSGEPLEFRIGKGEVPPGFERTIIGMKTGEEKITLLQPEEAFGNTREGVAFEVSKNSFPEDIELFIGQEIWAQKPTGEDFRMFVTDIDEDIVTLDENHPLAGKDVVLDVELVEIL